MHSTDKPPTCQFDRGKGGLQGAAGAAAVQQAPGRCECICKANCFAGTPRSFASAARDRFFPCACLKSWGPHCAHIIRMGAWWAVISAVVSTAACCTSTVILNPAATPFVGSPNLLHAPDPEARPCKYPCCVAASFPVMLRGPTHDASAVKTLPRAGFVLWCRCGQLQQYKC